jgi:spoIIIJ-associated protein
MTSFHTAHRGSLGWSVPRKQKSGSATARVSRRTATPRQKAKDLVRDAFQLAEEPQAKAQPEPAPAPAAAAVPEPTPENLDKALRIGEEALRRIVDFITDDAKISTETNDQRILFKVEGGNSGMLIGKRGQTLEAIQYLVEKIVNKQNDQRVRVLVDVEGYLKTRKTNLQNMAERMAEKAQRTKKPATIGQMNAYDRRTVHLHLKSNPAVRTQSVGEGYYRKLIIFPKKRQRNRKSG